MAPKVTDSPTTPSTGLAFLEPHLPQSLPILRRLQNFHLGNPGHARYLFSSDPDQVPGHFAAAYLDFSQGPETEMWFFSTLDGTSTAQLSPTEEAHVLNLICALFRRVRHIAETFTGHPDPAKRTYHPHGVMVGCFDEVTRRLLMAKRGFTMGYSTPHDKWLFRVDELPRAVLDLKDEGLRWDVVRREDVGTVVARTKIPRTEATLMSWPGLAVREGEGSAVAWGFMGPDGTLSTLHVEASHRKRGIAKAIATKVLLDHSGKDGWGSADVHIENHSSQAVCRSIGGKKAWRMSWSIVDFDSIPDSD